MSTHTNDLPLAGRALVDLGQQLEATRRVSALRVAELESALVAAASHNRELLLHLAEAQADAAAAQALLDAMSAAKTPASAEAVTSAEMDAAVARAERDKAAAHVTMLAEGLALMRTAHFEACARAEHLLNTLEVERTGRTEAEADRDAARELGAHLHGQRESERARAERSRAAMEGYLQALDAAQDAPMRTDDDFASYDAIDARLTAAEAAMRAALAETTGGECGARDWFSPRVCRRSLGHDGFHDDPALPPPAETPEETR